MVSTRQEVLRVLGVVGLLLELPCLLLASEGGSSMTKEPDRDSAVQEGMVVAFGKKLPPPYYVSWDNGKVLINGVVYLPRAKDPNKQPVTVVVTELDHLKDSLIRSFGRSYAQYYRQFGEARAKRMVQEEYGYDSLIADLKFEDDGQVLRIEFTDGDHMNIELTSFTTEDAGSRPSESEIAARQKEEVAILRLCLCRGYMVAFGYDYSIYAPVDMCQAAQGIIREATSGSSSIEKMKAALTHLVGEPSFTDDVTRDLDSWR